MFSGVATNVYFTGIKGKVPDTETVPVSLRKMKKIGFHTRRKLGCGTQF